MSLGLLIHGVTLAIKPLDFQIRKVFQRLGQKKNLATKRSGVVNSDRCRSKVCSHFK